MNKINFVSMTNSYFGALLLIPGPLCAGVTGDMVPSADPVLGTKPAGGSRSHWRIWFWQEPHPPCGIYGGLDSPQLYLQCTYVRVRTSLWATYSGMHAKDRSLSPGPNPPNTQNSLRIRYFFIPTWYKLVVPTIHHARFQVKNNFAENTTMEIRVKRR